MCPSTRTLSVRLSALGVLIEGSAGGGGVGVGVCLWVWVLMDWRGEEMYGRKEQFQVRKIGVEN